MRKLLILPLAIASTTFFASSSFAQVATDPVGFTTLTVNAKPANKKGFTLISLNMTRLPVFQSLIPSGGVSTDGSNRTVLTFPANTFQDAAFNPIGGAGGSNGPTHYIEILNGANAGRISDIVSNTATQLTLADNIAASITGGTTTITIRPMWSFSTAFGTNNSAGFAGGTSATGTTDVISLINPANGAPTNYFYHSTQNRWQTGLTNATNHSIPPDVGLRIERKAQTPLSFNLVGGVKLGTTGIFIQGGSAKALNYVPNPYPLASVKLKDLNLYTGDPNTGVAGSGNPASADNLSIYDTNAGTFTNYFYNNNITPQNPAPGRWQTGLTPANDVVIAEGAAVLIQRKSNRPSFIWYMPQPPMNLN